MIYLVLSILSSALIFIVFKWIGKLKVNTFQIIVINYFVAGVIGWGIQGMGFLPYAYSKDWFFPAMILGFTFTGMFYLMAITTDRVGAASASVANKMSVIIPVVVAFFLYGDKISLLKISAIILALVGIVFASRRTGQGDLNRGIWLIVLLFVGSGLIDTIIKFLETFFLSDKDIIPFTALLFLSAFSMGFVILLFRMKTVASQFTVGKLRIGILLGAINFASIYFLILALRKSQFDSSVLFPLNNIGVVVMSAFLSVLIFKEKLSRINLMGIGISVIALVILIIAG